MKLNPKSILGSIAIASLLLAGSQLPAHSVDYAAPKSPEVVDVTPATGGVKVVWKAVEATPKVTHYIVSGGQGSCPIMVPANKSSAVLPVLSMTDVDVTVQAANEYGLSPEQSFGLLVAPKSKASSNLKSVQLLQFSDFHGALEGTSSIFGADGLAGQFALERSIVPATVALSSGDNFGAAPPISSQFEELPTIKALNAMKLDVSTFGNHEHDRNLKHLRTMINESGFQWVVSNYSSLAGLKASNAKAAKSYTIVKKGGVNIGVIGINTT